MENPRLQEELLKCSKYKTVQIIKANQFTIYIEMFIYQTLSIIIIDWFLIIFIINDLKNWTFIKSIFRTFECTFLDKGSKYKLFLMFDFYNSS